MKKEAGIQYDLKKIKIALSIGSKNPFAKTMKIFTNCKILGTNEPIEIRVENGIIQCPQPTQNDLYFHKVDLKEKYVLPGFIDSHCHILYTGTQLQKTDLSSCQNKEEFLKKVLEAHQNTPEKEWLMVKNYDPAKLPESEHLSQQDLDQISNHRPIVVQHVSGHAGVINTGTLMLVPSAHHNRGYVVEKEYEKIYSSEPVPSLEKMAQSILLAGSRLKEMGITCATEMMAGYHNLEQELLAYHLASQRGCPIRLRLFLLWDKIFGPNAIPASRLKDLIDQMDPDVCKVVGIKLFADGVLGTKTAAVYEEYIGGGYGELVDRPDVFKKKVRVAHDAGWPVAVHSIGDRSTDLVLEAFSELDDASCHRIEHMMSLNDDQIERMAKLDCSCSMQPEFLADFHHSYQKHLGSSRTSKLKRFRSVFEAGISLGLSSDRPIVKGDPWKAIQIASNRPKGFDSSENLPFKQAVHAYTQGSAKLNHDHNSLGKLESGYFADFQIYQEDPFSTPYPTLLATLVGGKER